LTTHPPPHQNRKIQLAMQLLHNKNGLKAGIMPMRHSSRALAPRTVQSLRKNAPRFAAAVVVPRATRGDDSSTADAAAASPPAAAAAAAAAAQPQWVWAESDDALAAYTLLALVLGVGALPQLHSVKWAGAHACVCACVVGGGAHVC
jgi:hypothetical protein